MIEGKEIAAVIVSLILLAVGLFAIGIIMQEQSDMLPESSSSVSTTTYIETFEDDTNETDPTATWYNYNETGWDWANASNDTARAHTGNFTYRINDSDGDQDWTEFNFVSDDYNYTKFWFQIDNRSHDTANVSFRKSNGVEICRICIENENISFLNSTTTGWDNMIDGSSYYGVRLDFNFTTDEVRGRLYNYTGGTLNDTWLEMYDGSEAFTETALFNISGETGSPAYIWFDNWQLYDRDVTAAEYETPDMLGTANSVFTILGILIIVGAIMMIVVLMYPYMKR